MDARYLFAALAITVGFGVWEYAYGYNQAAAFVYPFATIVLLFLWVTGDSPSKRVVHWMSEPAMK